MRAILRQTKANLRYRKLQAASTLLTLFAATMLLTVALNSLHTAQGSYDRLFQRTNGAHLWFQLDPGLVTIEEADLSLRTLPGVEATTVVMHTISGTIFLGEDRLGGVLLREWPQGPARVNRDLIVDGRAPEPGEKNVILLDRNVAVSHHVQIGDQIDILTPVGRHPLVVVGLYISAETCPYGNCWPPVMYLTYNAFQELGLTSLPVSNTGSFDIGLRLDNPESIKAVVQDAEEKLPEDALSGWYSWKSIRRAADGSIRNWRILLLTFSVVAGLAAVILIINNIGGAVRAQTRQIGLLKAVGFTGGQLAGIYLTESLAFALIAAFGGLTIGSLASGLILLKITSKFGESLIRPPVWIFIVVPISTLIIAAFATLLPIRHAVQLDAVSAIRTGAERPRRRATRLPRGPISLMIGWTDVLTRPFHAILTSLGLAMAVLTVSAALTLNATFSAFLSDPGMLGFDGDVFLQRTHYISDPEVRTLIDAHTEVTNYYIERWRTFQFEGEEEFLRARFRDGDLASFNFPLVEGRMFEEEDEAVVGYGLVRERGIHLGDEIKITIEGQAFALKVVGIYRENSNLGRMLLLPLGILHRVIPDLEIYSYVLKIKPGSDPKALATSLNTASNYLVEINIAGEAGLPEDMAASKSVMVGLSSLMGILAIVGVLSNLWMGVQERQGEFGMLKAVGMTPGQVTFSVITGAVIMGLMGYIVGMPIGLVGIRLLMDFVARWVGFGPLNPPVDVVGQVLVLPGIVLAAVVGALIPASRAGKVSVVEMLRYE